MSEQRIISIQFNNTGRSYDFTAPIETEIRQGDFVVVNTMRGLQVGKVVDPDKEITDQNLELVAIERVATDEDLAIKEALTQKEAEAVENVAEFLRESRFQDVKVINAEYSLDSSRVTLFLNYDAESNFDIKGFLREASHLFKSCRIEVRQVGPRDMAKMVSGLGACGIEKRCCSRFLKEFSSISIKMAKAQDISLTPNEITGICGRLRCCLGYEYKTYEEALQRLPKKKKLIQTPLGEGKVSQLIPLADSVIVYLPELGNRKFTRQELESGVMAEQKPEPIPAEVPEEHPNGDVQLLKLAPIPEQKDAAAEQQHARGRRQRREKARPAANKAAPAKEDSAATPVQHNEQSQRRKRKPETRRERVQGSSAQPGTKAERHHRPSQNPDQNRAEKAVQQPEGVPDESKPRKFRRPRREWIKKS